MSANALISSNRPNNHPPLKRLNGIPTFSLQRRPRSDKKNIKALGQLP